MPSDAQKQSKAPALIAAAVLLSVPLATHFEGLRTRPNPDPADPKLTQVCYGDTKVAMRVYTADECAVLLTARQQRDYAPAVLKCVPAIGDKPKMFAASIDAAYNAGVAAFCRSPMAKRFNAGDWLGGCTAFRDWYTTAKGKVFPGLVKRRQAEQTLCYEDAPRVVSVVRVNADYQVCATVNNGPVTKAYRLPYQRKADNA